MEFTENQLKASICRDSFWEFVKEFWSTYIHEPLIENWHMEYLCNEIQKPSERVFKQLPKEYDLLINICPGSTKTTIVSVMHPIWCWTKAPWIRTINASFTDRLSMINAGYSQDIFLSKKFSTLYPEIKPRTNRGAVSLFYTENDGWRHAVSVKGSPQGEHAHILSMDDLVDPRGSRSDAELLTANTFMFDVMANRKVNQTTSFAMMVAQRLAQNDPPAMWLKKKKQGQLIKHICIPAEITDDVRPRKLKRFYINGLMDPVRLPRKILDEKKLDGEYTYAGQFLQSPIPIGGGIFKTSKMEILNIDYKSQKGWKLYRYWDKAYSKDSGAYTVGVLMGKDPHGVFWVLDVVRGQWSSEEREEIIKQTAQKDGVNVIIKVEQEPAAGKESVQATIKNLAGFNATADNPRSKGSKTFRADPYAAQVNIGNVKLLKADWNDEYLTELSFFPNSTYKDQVDASSGAFSFLNQKQLYIGSLR